MSLRDTSDAAIKAAVSIPRASHSLISARQETVSTELAIDSRRTGVGAWGQAVGAPRRYVPGPASYVGGMMMKATMKAALAAVLAMLGSACGPPPPPAHASLSELEAYVRTRVDEGTPSISVAVVRGGDVIYERAVGMADGPRQVPATPQTTYRWWSISKPFTAVAIMQLEEEGLLELDAPVARYLPDLEGALSRVTIAQLLSHSSGLDDVGASILTWIHYDEQHPSQTRLLYDKVDDFGDLGSAPGAEGRYSNFGYIVLSAVIEAVTHMPYEAYVRAHVLRPIGMAHTDFFYSELVGHAREARGSHPRDFMSFVASFMIDFDLAVREQHEGRHWFNRLYPDQTGPSGLLGTSEDMTRFMAAIFAGGTTLLEEASLTRMLTPVVACERQSGGCARRLPLRTRLVSRA